MKKNIVREKSLQFALDVIELYREMTRKHEYVLSKQVLRSATSIGANIEEASAAQSRRDFVAKMTISSKEARETLYWLKLIELSGMKENMESLKADCLSIVKLLTAIVKTTQKDLDP